MDENTFKKNIIYCLWLLKDHRQDRGYIAMEKSGATGVKKEPNEVSTLPQHKWNSTTTNLNKDTEFVGREFPNSVTVCLVVTQNKKMPGNAIQA